MEVQLQVVVDPNLNGLVDGAVSFETGLTRAQAADPNLFAYEHHGSEFSPIDPGALSSFHEDILLGRPLPAKFVTRFLQVDTVFAIALFLHRDLATIPALPGIVASVDLVHRRGPQGMAHVDEDFAKFLWVLSDMFYPDLPKNREAENLKLAVGWVREYVTQGNLPSGPAIPEVTVKTRGSRGFTLAECAGEITHLLLGWVRLYQHGFLRGAIYSPPSSLGKRHVVVSRKSVYVEFDLTRAASLLNEIEVALGGSASWRQADELWLYSPWSGTRIHPDHLQEVFLRV